jgi:hypothetical protein
LALNIPLLRRSEGRNKSVVDVFLTAEQRSGLLIPIDLAHHSEMISPTVPI